MSISNDFIGSIAPRKNAFTANSETLETVVKTTIVEDYKEIKKINSTGFEPKEKIQYKMATFRLPAEKITKLQELAKKRGSSQAELMNYAIDNLLKELAN